MFLRRGVLGVVVVRMPKLCGVVDGCSYPHWRRDELNVSVEELAADVGDGSTEIDGDEVVDDVVNTWLIIRDVGR